MISPVLIDQPRRALPSFVAAEPAARAGKPVAARSDVWTFVAREDIFPWFPGILLAILGILIWALVHRR